MSDKKHIVHVAFGAEAVNAVENVLDTVRVADVTEYDKEHAQFSAKQFTTRGEAAAYMAGVRDGDGWSKHMFLLAVEAKKMRKFVHDSCIEE